MVQSEDPIRGRQAMTIYPKSHRKLRAEWEKIVAAGDAFCSNPKCGLPIVPGEPWHLAHDHTEDREGVPNVYYEGAQHAKCNIADRNERNNPRIARERAVKRSVESGWQGITGPGGEHWSRQWLPKDFSW
jgi:hypothetical protein